MKNKAMLALPIVWLIMQFSNTYIKTILGIILVVSCCIVGLYFFKKGSKAMMGIMLISALIVFISLASTYLQQRGYNGNYLAAFIPALLIILTLFIYKAIYKICGKEKLRDIKGKAIIGIIVFSILQVILIYGIFLKKR